MSHSVETITPEAAFELLAFATSPDDPPPARGDWKPYDVGDRFAGYRLDFDGGVIRLEPRPAYCNRGDFLAHLDHKPPAYGGTVNLSNADLWPRYLFGLEVAKSQCEEWLRRHGIDPATGQPKASDT